MKFTDLFIRRPVLAIVISLLILVLGLRSVGSLPVNQYPHTENAVVTISTAYYGADAATVAGFITQPLESAIAQAQGIDYLSSSSTTGLSTITATLRLNYDSNRALTEINTQVNSVKNQLPPQAQQPVLTVQVGQTIDAMYMGFYSDTIPTNNVTDYLVRVVKPKLDSLQGVQTAEILGARQFALRAWLDASKLAAHNVTAQDVFTALGNNNYLAAVGSSKGQMVTVDLTAGTDLHSVQEFRQLVVKQVGDSIVRLEDVAEVTLGAENYDLNVAFSGKRSVFIGIKVAPQANILSVAKRVRDAFPELVSQLPTGVSGHIVYDSTEFINTSITEVVKTLVESLVIVTIVIFLFLGSLRAVIIPVIAMPLSLIGTFFVMLALGYSINLLTLLALVLAIGLVVDDAIIVVENVDRHMKQERRSALDAALVAARELGGPILAMTVVLVAVYVPIGFQGGLTGALFTEFAFSLAGAVAVSGIIALTLSPMMCAVFFRSNQDEGRLAKAIDRNFEWFRERYHRTLHALLDTWPVLVVMAFLLLLVLVACFKFTKAELAPEEDQGVVLAKINGPPNATAQQMQTYADQVFKIASQEPEYKQMFQITGVPTVNQGIGGALFKPWDQRTRSAHELQLDLQQKWAQIAGAQVFAFQFPPLPGSSGFPVQFVITSTEPFQNLNDVAQAVVAKALAKHAFFFADVDLKLDKPQATLVVDRDKVAALGLTQSDVGSALGRRPGRRLRQLFLDLRALLQGDSAGSAGGPPESRTGVGLLHPHAVGRHVAGEHGRAHQVFGGAGVDQPLSAAEFRDHRRRQRHGTGGHPEIPQGHRQTGRAERLYGGLRGPVAPVHPGVRRLLHHPGLRDHHRVSGAGRAVRELPRSHRDSRLRAAGAVGRGDVHDHGICLAQHLHAGRAGDPARADQQARHSDRAVRQRAAALGAHQARRDRSRRPRCGLRPILMTTAAMVLGVVPLVLASGAGAAGRHDMGLVIFTGLSIGTLFTLFVVPAVYMMIGADHSGLTPVHDEDLPQSAA